MKKKSGGSGYKEIIAIVGMLSLVVIIILVLANSISSQATVSGSINDGETSLLLDCLSEDIVYPFTEDNKAIKKEVNVKVLFKNSNQMSSIALTQKFRYTNDSDAVDGKARSHASMNLSFGESGLGADALNANYYSGNSEARMQLYASESEYVPSTRKYFLINGSPKTITDFRNNYTKQGFDCTSNSN